MSSMTKVMQKLAGTGGPADQAAAIADTQLSEPPSAASAFVAEGGASPPRAFALPTLNDETSTWQTHQVDPSIIAFHDRYSTICERYRSIRARLLTMNPTRAPQVIALTSAVRREGKSVSAANLSLVMAEGGEQRVLLVDADLRRGSIARLLGIPESPGLVELLRGQATLAETLRPSPLPNLRVLPAGTVGKSGCAELLGGAAVTSLLNTFRRVFDYTLVDTPPVTIVSDVCLLAPRCDGAILVIQMHRTPEPTVQQAVRTLQANQVRILGSILSHFSERDNGYYDNYPTSRGL